MASRLLPIALLVSAAACGGDDTASPPDATPPPDGGIAIGSCGDFIGTGSFRFGEPPALWHVAAGVPTQLLAEEVRGFAVSPDRTRIAIPRPFAVHVIELGTGERTIVPLEGTATKVAWTTRDPIVVIASGVWAIDTAAGQARAIYGGSWADARISPDGARVAALGSQGVSALTLETRIPTPLPVFAERLVGWSDTESVLTVGGGEATSLSVTSIGGDSRVLRNLVTPSELTLSPDGALLAYRTSAESGWAVVVTDLELTTGFRVFELGARIGVLSWASDDELLYYQRSASTGLDELRVIRTDSDSTSVRSRLVTRGTWLEAFALGPCTAASIEP